MEELQIQISNTLGEITTNFAEIEANLKKDLENYKGIVVTEDTVKESKKDVAELRKKRTEIEDRRKEIKKAWNEPYVAFENDCKRLLALIDVPINEINSQIKEFDDKRKEEKLSHLHELFDEHIGEYGDYLTFEGVFNEKWLNVSTKDTDVLFDLSEKITHIRTDLDAIKALNSEIEDEVIAAYKNSGNSLAIAIKKNSDYLAAKALAEKKLAEEAKKEEVKQPEEPFMNPPVEAAPSFTFRIEGEENIKLVKEYLNFAEIKYQEV